LTNMALRIFYVSTLNTADRSTSYGVTFAISTTPEAKMITQKNTKSLRTFATLLRSCLMNY